ncbi:MAG: hypothetical protein M0P01_15280 [Treponema sp.]|nr:hypothetical protein [Treponema sp.]
MTDGNFSELIKLLSLTNIQIMDSHETVLQNLQINEGEQIQIRTEQGLNQEDPVIENKTIVFRPKYTFTFSLGGKNYFRAEYIIFVTFEAKDIKRFTELFADNELKTAFFSRQLNRTLWSILRGSVMDACNRHSVHPVPLPWVM